MWTVSKSPRGIPKKASANQRAMRGKVALVLFSFGTHQMACMVPLGENVRLCGVDTKKIMRSTGHSE